MNSTCSPIGMLSTLPAKILAQIATYLLETDLKNFRLVSRVIADAIFDTFAKKCYRRFKLKVSQKNVATVTTIFRDIPGLAKYIEEVRLEFIGSHIWQHRRDALELYNRSNPHNEDERLPDLRTIEAMQRGESRTMEWSEELVGCLKGARVLRLTNLNGKSLEANIFLFQTIGNVLNRLILKENLLSSCEIAFFLSLTTPNHLTIWESKFPDGLANAAKTLLTFELESFELKLYRESGPDEDRRKLKQEPGEGKRVQKFFHMGKGSPIEHFQVYEGWMRMSGRRGVREGLGWVLRMLEEAE